MASKVAPEVTGADGVAASGAKESHELRRAVGVWGSYTWGNADVGADVYVALGIVMAAAQGATNIAFLFAGLVYVMVGLAYTELLPPTPWREAASSMSCAAWAISWAS
jgi:APA family basic amino acid/polyamine antiporter